MTRIAFGRLEELFWGARPDQLVRVAEMSAHKPAAPDEERKLETKPRKLSAEFKNPENLKQINRNNLDKV